MKKLTRRRSRGDGGGPRGRRRSCHSAHPSDVPDGLLRPRREARQAHHGPFMKETGIELNVRYASSRRAGDGADRGGRTKPGGRLLGHRVGHARPRRGEGSAEAPPAEHDWEGAIEVLDAEPALGRDERALARARLQHAGAAPAGLPRSVWTLTNPRWKGKVGLPPTNGSFQAFVGAMLHLHGEDRTRDWLRRTQRQRRASFFPSNTTTVQAVARGDVQVGLVNHYYLYNLLADNPDLPVQNHWFRAGDPGDSFSPQASASSPRRRRTSPRSGSSTSCSRSGPSGSSPAAPAPRSTR